MTMNESIMNALYDLEDAQAAVSREAERRDEARNKLMQLIAESADARAKQAHEDGVRDGQSRLFPRISLIKLVREATLQHMRREVTERTTIGTPLSCMGLKDAKDMVDAWVAEHVSKGAFPGGVA